MPLFPFNPRIGPYQVLLRRARVDLGAMAIKGYSAFPKAPAPLEPHHLTVQRHMQDTRWGGGSCASAEKQSVYSTTPADWANKFWNVDNITQNLKQNIANGNTMF